MTQLEVHYRYAVPPTERVLLALSKVRDVYGVRLLELREADNLVRVEYDASRLTGAVIDQLLRRSGLDIAETVPLIAPPAEIDPPAPLHPSVA